MRVDRAATTSPTTDLFKKLATFSLPGDVNLVYTVGGVLLGEVVRVDGGRDQRVWQIATRQRGRVSHGQLRQAGLSDGVISGMMRRGQLVPEHRGVYAVGHQAPIEWAAETAAALAFTAGSALGRHSAGALWAMLAPRGGEVEVLVPRGRAGPRPGLTVIKTASLTRGELRRSHGLPVTSPARTLFDLAPVLTARELERALDEALVRGLVRHDELLRMVEQRRSWPGVTAMRELLESQNRESTLTRAALEESFLGTLRSAGLPSPAVNARVQHHIPDFLWREQRLIVEMDGWRFHRTRRSFENDRAREAALVAQGYIVMHGTWRQLEQRPFELVARIAQALVRAEARAEPHPEARAGELRRVSTSRAGMPRP